MMVAALVCARVPHPSRVEEPRAPAQAERSLRPAPSVLRRTCPAAHAVRPAVSAAGVIQRDAVSPAACTGSRGAANCAAATRRGTRAVSRAARIGAGRDQRHGGDTPLGTRTNVGRRIAVMAICGFRARHGGHSERFPSGLVRDRGGRRAVAPIRRIASRQGRRRARPAVSGPARLAAMPFQDGSRSNNGVPLSPNLRDGALGRSLRGAVRERWSRSASDLTGLSRPAESYVYGRGPC
jgi:hypothetical protein